MSKDLSNISFEEAVTTLKPEIVEIEFRRWLENQNHLLRLLDQNKASQDEVNKAVERLDFWRRVKREQRTKSRGFLVGGTN